ncbi:MAG: TIGR02611 family protein [Myxococcaceae bacterium]|nr:MAG: TIGR02611 family protein [Myxococcaceae bacterium]
MTRPSTRAGDERRPGLRRLANLVGGWALVVVGIILIPLPGPGWLVVGFGLVVLSREVRWARGALVRLERFMRRHGMRTSLRRLIARRQRERARRAPMHHPSVQPMDPH